MLLLMAAALPVLYWDGGPETQTALRDAGITRVMVPAERLAAWKGAAGITVESGSVESAVKLTAPSVDNQINRGGATSMPWVNTNGWQFARQPQGRFVYDVKGAQAPLAAAEAFAFGVNAMIRSDAAGLKPLAQMLTFLGGVPASDMPGVADIGFFDDGTDVAGEVMNLMVRSNLLFRPLTAPDRRVKVSVKLGTKDYPLEMAQDPTKAAQLIRSNLKDERRSVRIYGTQVVVARVAAAGARLRVQLLNYAGERRKVDGVRVRVLGRYSRHQALVADSTENQLLDFTNDAEGTEFTLRELKTYAVIDLSR